MRISFVLPNDSLAGGIRVIAIYAERLRQRGHKVTVVCTPAASPSARDRVRALVKEGRWVNAPKPPDRSHFDALDIDFRTIERYRPVTDDDLPDADVVVATWWETAGWVARLQDSKGAKAYFMQDYGAPGQTLEQIVPTWSLPLHLITIAPWLDRLIQQHASRTATVVMNAVDLEVFSAPPRERQAVPTFGFVASELASKGTATAIKAVLAAREQIPALRVVAFGAARPQQFPAWGEFHVQPADATAAEIYRSCDAWLFASEIEGFGLPILEAMACRTPVIATPAGAAPELLADGGGTVLSRFDAEAMTSAIVELASTSAQRWKAMSDSASNTATAYTWEQATLLFERALERAIEESAQPHRQPAEVSG